MNKPTSSTLSIWGGIILFLSFCFGFYGLMNANFSGPISEVQIGNVNSSIAYFGLMLLWGILGATLLICGTIKNSLQKESEKNLKVMQEGQK